MSEPYKPFIVGRYLLHRKIARGGMATIHIARLMGDVGFSRIVAAKRMHPELLEDSEFVAMFLDEARIASKVHHRNVVNVLDVVTLGQEAMLVQEYVHGAPLSVLLRSVQDAKAYVPVPVAAAIACQVLAGLHAAHVTVDELGTPLHIVHRDVSPQNIMVGVDGTVRLLDFGVAKAALTAHVSRKGVFKGKLGYSSPEQIRGNATKQSDIYSLAVVLWELLVGHRLHSTAQDEAQLIAEIMTGKLPAITEALAPQRTWIGPYRWSQLEAIEPVVRKALDVSARRRWSTAAELEEAIAAVLPVASPADVAAWLRAVGKAFLDERDQLIADEETSWRRHGATVATPAAAESAHTPQPRPTTGAATDPDQPPQASSAHTLQPWWLMPRMRSAMVAMLAMVLVGTVALLMRDLDDNDASPRAAAAPAAPPSASSADTAPAAVVPDSDAAASATQSTIVVPRADGSNVAPPRDDANVAPRPIAPAPAAKAVARVRHRPTSASRPAPRSAPAQPPRQASPPLDCSTPFYFEGRKKIFKTGCL